MICIGGTNDGVGRSGHSFETQWIRVACLERDAAGEVVRAEIGEKEVKPYVSELYHRASHPRLGPFWRHESLDTEEKVEAAVAIYLARPPKPSAFDRISGGKQPPRIHSRRY